MTHMKRLFVVLLLGALVFPVHAMERYLAGTHYQVVGDVNAPKPEKPIVTEFFSYGCPHCEHLEPHVQSWYSKNKGKVTFERVPAQWSPYFKLLGQLYLALDKLGVAEKHSAAVFDYIHKKRKPLRNQEQVMAFAAEHLELDAAAFQAAWDSDEVKQRLNQAGKDLRKYKVSGVPAILVNHRYYVSVKSAGSEKELFEVVDFLLTK